MPAPVSRPLWLPPVPGPVLRTFTYGPDLFAAGSHRGVDLRVRPGATVRSVCAGRVRFAGAVPGGGQALSVGCGAWRVTLLPLTHLAVGEGEQIRRGQRVGVAAAASSHPGLHLGVRAADNRWGYVDPMPLIGRRAPAPVPVARVPSSRGLKRLPPALRRGPVRRGPQRIPIRRLAPARAPAPVATSVPAARDAPLAPPAAWVGLALLLGVLLPVARIRAGTGRRKSLEGLRAKEARPVLR